MAVSELGSDVKSLRVMMIGPFPRSRQRIDGGVAAATMFLSDALVLEPGIDLVGVRVTGRASTRRVPEKLGWPVLDIDLGRFSVSTMFRRQQRQFAALLNEYKPDIVHAQGADAAGFLAVRAGYPSIVTVHGILSECAKFRTSPVKRIREQLQARMTEQLVVERAKDIIAISPYVARYYKQRLRGVVHDIPNAVAPAYFEVQRNPQAKRFLFAGRISKGKGLIDLVRAVALRPLAARRVVLAGASPEPDFDVRLRAAIAGSGHANIFELVGLLDEQALLAEFSVATALVLPSYQETAPLVVQQAMAAGLPVIATRVGGIPDMMKHGETGILVEPGDSEALGDALVRIGGDPELGRRLAAAAREKALESFAAVRVAKETVTAYRSALATVQSL